MKIPFVIFTAVLAMLTVSCGQTGKTADQSAEDSTVVENTAEVAQEAAKIEAGAAAPDFTVTTLEGQEVTLSSSFEGKYVVLDFWGIWCKWCVKGIPEMKAYYAKYSDKMEIVSIDANDELQKLRDFVRQEGMTWTQIANDSESGTDLCSLYQVQGFPTKIIIAPSGDIVEVYVGEVPEFYAKLDELMQ